MTSQFTVEADTRTDAHSNRPLTGASIAEGLSRDAGLDRAGESAGDHLAALGASFRRISREGGRVPAHIDIDGHSIETDIIGWPRDEAPFHEVLAQAACGVMSVHGRAEGTARRLSLDYVSVLGGTLATTGLLAAVLGALRGRGISRVTTPVACAGLLAVNQYLAGATAEGDPEQLSPSPATAGTRPPFATADGVRFELEILDPDRWRRFWAALGAPDEAVERSWPSYVLRYARGIVDLRPELTATIASITYDWVLAVATSTGASVCRVRGVEERLDDARLWPATGDRAPWLFTAGSPASEQARAPAATGALPLAGMTVVESTRRIQGPLATKLLADLGARVVRIEPPGGDPLRWMPPTAGDCSARFLALNHAKDIVEIDIKSREGRREIADLVREADVFLHNWAPGKAAELGLDSNHLHAVNQRLVYAHASGWGDALGSEPPLGTDFMVQAHSGIAAALTGRGRPPAPSLMTLLDIYGGVVAAEGIVAGLLAAHRFGAGQRVDTSLLSASTELLPVRPAPLPPRGAVVSSVFATAAGSLALVAETPDAIARLHSLIGHPARRPAVDTVVEALRGKSAAEWTTLFAAAGIGAAEVVTDLAAVPRDPRFRGQFQNVGCAVIASPWRFQ